MIDPVFEPSFEAEYVFADMQAGYCSDRPQGEKLTSGWGNFDLYDAFHHPDVVRLLEDKIIELRCQLYGAPDKSFQDYLKLCRELFDAVYGDINPRPWLETEESVALWKRAKNLLGMT